MAIRYLLLLLMACIAYGDDKHLICKQVNDIFSDGNPPPTRAISQGRAGKRGSPGIKGERGDLGPPGPPAVVNYAQIQEAVERNVSTMTTTNFERVVILSQIHSCEIVPPRSNGKKRAPSITMNIPSNIQDNCDIFYIGKCFRAILRDTSDVSLAAAQTMCRDIGWQLANIYDGTHYGRIRDYLRGKIPSSRTWNTAWLGMTIIPQSKEIRYSDGRVASDAGFQWYPGYPSSDPTFTKIGIHINKDPASRMGYTVGRFEPVT